MDQLLSRILKQLNQPDLLDQLNQLSTSDLNSLLLAIYRNRTDRISAPELLKHYHQNRFVQPVPHSLTDYYQFQIDLLQHAQAHQISSTLLSPSAPLGSCSVFGCVAQNNVLSSVRQTETLADPTNMLALIIADKIKQKEIDATSLVTLATTARVVRGQPIPDIPGFYAHFGIYCMVSSLRDQGSYQSEIAMLTQQLTYYRTFFEEKLHGKLSVRLRKRGKQNEQQWQIFIEAIHRLLPEVDFTYDLDHEENGYYQNINFKLFLNRDGVTTEVGDGGFVDWMGKLLSNQKQCCLISGLGMDRLLSFRK